jgi:hypothetical protein
MQLILANYLSFRAAAPPLVDTAVIETKTEYQLRGAVIVGGEVLSCPRGSQTSSLSILHQHSPIQIPPTRRIGCDHIA